MFAKILTLGWKNIWRSPTRSAVVIVAVVLGLWAGVFISAFFNGMAQGYLQNQLELSIGHVQVRHPEFGDLMQPSRAIPDAENLADSLRGLPSVSALRSESIASGLAQSAHGSYGVTIHGLDGGEGDLSPHPVQKHLVEGSMPGPGLRNPVTVGGVLADRLNLEMGSRLVLSFQDTSGEITAGAFRVAGIYDSFYDQYDRGNVFVQREDLTRLLGDPGLVHRITLMIDDYGRAPEFRRELAAGLPGLEVRSWDMIAPELQYVYNSMDISLYVIMIIILIALVFSIVNTMLMAILERTKELGMLMAVGMNRVRLFGMILAETFFLTMAGTPLGLLLSWITVNILGRTGIDLGPFSEGLSAYGLGTVIYPELTAAYYLNIALLVASAAFLSALYPAWKTLKLNPLEAIHKI